MFDFREQPLKLVHGDCLDEMERIPDGSIDLVLADPPYGVTACQWDSIIPLEPMWRQLKRVTKPNAAIVMTARQPFTTTLISSNMKMFKYCWVWDKKQGTGFLNARKQPLKNCEDVVVFYSKQCTYHPIMRSGYKPYVHRGSRTHTDNYGKHEKTTSSSLGERYPVQLLHFPHDQKREHRGHHPTQKPVALMKYLIKTYTHEGATVLDFAMGSGTTGVACKALQRGFIGIELEKSFYDLAVERVSCG